MTHVPWHADSLEQGEEIHGIDSVVLTSVGIDIGTTTTHLMFSTLTARRKGGDHSSKFDIVDRSKEYESPVRFTPFDEAGDIDQDALGAIIDEWYEAAGIRPEDVDTGAVIITGIARRTGNAEAITELFSEQAGKFVCATAGPNLEAMMAAHGSGAVDLSVDEGLDVLHIDIGGGTTEFSFISGGFVLNTASINVGARLVTLDDDGRVERVDDSAVAVAEDVGIELGVGAVLSEADRAALAGRFARVLFEVVDGEPSPLARSLMGTEFPDEYDFDTITFSGGVSEYIYGREHAFYHDLGPELGSAVREQLDGREFEYAMLDTGIRATAAGSNQYSMEVSGNTIMISDAALLPLRNVPMVPFTADADEPPASIREKVHRKLDLYDIDEVDGPFAYGFHLHGQPTYAFLDKVVEAAIEGLSISDPGHPAILMFDMDIGMSVGNLVKERTDRPVIAIDGIDLKQFGYVDVGEPLEHTDAVPVTVKSLVF